MTNALEVHRTKRGLTRSELARQVGISPRAYMRYATGERIPNIETGLRLERALGVPLQTLFRLETAS